MTIPQLDVGEISPLVYGYLHKLGRNGHWQCRFFETDGERLTYYKNVKRTNALATLDLLKVSYFFFFVCSVESVGLGPLNLLGVERREISRHFFSMSPRSLFFHIPTGGGNCN